MNKNVLAMGAAFMLEACSSHQGPTQKVLLDTLSSTNPRTAPITAQKSCTGIPERHDAPVQNCDPMEPLQECFQTEQIKACLQDMRSMNPDEGGYQSPATCKGSKAEVKACQQEIFYDIAAECYLKVFSCLQDAIKPNQKKSP